MFLGVYWKLTLTVFMFPCLVCRVLNYRLLYLAIGIITCISVVGVCGDSLTTLQVATKVRESAGIIYSERCLSVIMAAATVGRMEPFDPDRESIVVYLERMQLYFEANGIKAEKQVPVFLNLIGRENYGLLRDLSAPEKPANKSLKNLMDILKKHFEPKKVVIAARFQFHRRQQQPGETVAVFLAELRKMAVPCEFGNALNESLRDRLVCGLANEAHQKRLLSEGELSLDKALLIAQSLEMAEDNSRTLRGAEPAIHQLSKSTTKPQESVQQKESQVTPEPRNRECYRCGSADHLAASCRFVGYVCRKCHKKGHLAKVCRSRVPAGRQRTSGADAKAHQVTSAGAESEEEVPVLRLGGGHAAPITVDVTVNTIPVTMELDTGAAVSIMSEQQQREIFPAAKLQPSQVVLRTYTAESVAVVGVLPVRVAYGGQEYELSLVIVRGNGPALFGRDWLLKIRLDWHSITYHTVVHPELEKLLQKYEVVFREELGTIGVPPVHLSVKENSQPKFVPARSVPFAIKDAIAQDLERLQSLGIIEKVEFSRWATPIVPVPKRDGTFRICGDFKVTLNPVLQVDQYPIPKPEDIFVSLAGGKLFTTLDLSQAYQQLMMDEESKELVTINTHLGLFRYNRLPFGVASAPAIFQRTMDQLLNGLSGVKCYLDDIIVTGSNHREHLANLDRVLERLRDKGLRLKKSKCHCMQTSVEYLGHVLDANGVHTTPSKQRAIAEARAPDNVTELRSFLGLVNYYGRFLPNVSTVLHPLNRLLRKGAAWLWTRKCQEAFQVIKEMLSSDLVLAHYDPTLPLSLAADASAYGVGAVISQRYPDDSERPIAFASRTLTPTEQKYAQVEREALALVFGVKRFHQYLYGRKFTLITDHKPLTTILGPHQAIPTLAAARLQRWAITLSTYNYEIQFRPTEEHANADGLSRLPLHLPPGAEVSADAACYNLGQIQALPVTAAKLSAYSRHDPQVSRVMHYTCHGWPDSVPVELKPFFSRRDELTVESDCLLWGVRVVVPLRLRKRVLQDLHRDHGGVVRMKSVARSYMWWPAMDSDIEELAKTCQSCKAVKSAPSEAPMHPWLWPDQPWRRVHVDFAGPFKNKMFFLLMDAHSKWPERVEMKSTTAADTIAVLRRVFASFGLPEQLVSDNGPQFVSRDFTEFLTANGVKHIRVAPYHPASNGAIERFVQTFKQSMKAGEHDGLTLQHRVQNFLMTYRSTPHATTGQSPASLFLGRPIRTRFDLMRPVLGEKVRGEQAHQKKYHDAHTRFRQFSVGSRVMVRDGRDKSTWRPGTIRERRGPVSYLVQLDSGEVQRKHVDHLREGTPMPTPDPERESPSAEVVSDETPMADIAGVIPTSTSSDDSTSSVVLLGPSEAPVSTDTEEQHEQSTPDIQTVPESSEPVVPTVRNTSRRYPQRQRKPTDRYIHN